MSRKVTVASAITPPPVSLTMPARVAPVLETCARPLAVARSSTQIATAQRVVRMHNWAEPPRDMKKPPLEKRADNASHPFARSAKHYAWREESLDVWQCAFIARLQTGQTFDSSMWRPTCHRVSPKRA